MTAVAGVHTPAAVPGRGPAPLDLVWVAIRRRGIEAHKPNGEGSTPCGRSTRAGEQISALVAFREHGATWCLRCWPEPRPPKPTLTTADGDELLTAAQVARLFGVDAKSVNRWVTDGRLEPVESATRTRRFSGRHVRQLLDRSGR